MRTALAPPDVRRKDRKSRGKPARPGRKTMRSHVGTAIGAAAVLAFGLAPARAAPFMIVGNDEKVLWDDAGKPVISPAGKDSVLIVDPADPMTPKIVATLPLKNSIVGPPVNLDIDPTGSIALVADSVDVIREGDTLKQ